MKKFSVTVASTLMAVALATGCGGSGTSADLTGAGDLSTTPGQDLSIVLYKLVSGQYTINTVTDVNDGCEIMSGAGNSLVGTMFTLTNSGPPTGMVTFTGFGSGTIMSNMGTLTGSGNPTQGGCTYNYTTNIPFTITADNTFTANYTENDTNRTGTCTPSAATCTSTWTMTGSM